MNTKIVTVSDAKKRHGYDPRSDEIAEARKGRLDRKDEALRLTNQVLAAVFNPPSWKPRLPDPSGKEHATLANDRDIEDRDGASTFNIEVHLGRGYYLYPTTVVRRVESIAGPRYHVVDGWAIDTVRYCPATRDSPDDFDIEEVDLAENLPLALRKLAALIADDLAEDALVAGIEDE